MLNSNDLNTLYEWAKDEKFPCKKAPTIDGYCNKVIDYYWLKSVKKSTIIRQKYMSCLLYTSPSPRDRTRSRMPSSA